MPRQPNRSPTLKQSPVKKLIGNTNQQLFQGKSNLCAKFRRIIPKTPFYLRYRGRKRAPARPHTNCGRRSPGTFGGHFTSSGRALGREQPPQVCLFGLNRFGEQFLLRERGFEVWLRTGLSSFRYARLSGEGAATVHFRRFRPIDLCTQPRHTMYAELQVKAIDKLR